MAEIGETVGRQYI